MMLGNGTDRLAHSRVATNLLVFDFPGGSDGEASACNVGDQGSVPRLGRSPGEGNGTPLQYACLENPMDRGVWWAMVQKDVFC